MSLIVQVIVKATGGWGFHFGVTETQAYQILNARVGETVILNEPEERLRISDANTAQHFMHEKGGATSEDLVRQSILDKIHELINEGAWR